MKVRVRLFAGPRELLGTHAMWQEIPESASVEVLLAALYDAHPGLRAFRLRVAVNAAYVPLETALHAGDEVALIPPVGGG